MTTIASPSAIAKLGQLRPGTGMFVALSIWTTFAVVTIWLPGLFRAWAVAGAGLALLWLGDAWLALRVPAPRCERRVNSSLALGVWRDVSLRLHNPGGNTIGAWVFDGYPEASEIEMLPQRLKLAPGHWGELRYRLHPVERGDMQFSHIQVLLDSPLRLWRRNLQLGEPTTIRVYPNFAAVAKYALLATDNRLSQMGIRKRRRRGEGMEFHQLREYRDGDSLRQIDWKATSRQLKLISREYQDERDQQVIFLVDCGRRMLARDGELSHFDHSLNAVLLLSYVALRQGDAVGLLTFGGPQRYMPPQKGTVAINTLLNQVYDLQPGLNTPDYQQAASELLKRLKKRSLIVLVTNLRDEDNQELLPTISLLRRRHLLLLASLQEKIINQTLDQPVETFADAVRVAGVQQYLRARRKAASTLRGHGAELLDVEPQHLAVAMVNRYLDIKSSGKL